jgi:HK97 family phage portal protein
MGLFSGNPLARTVPVENVEERASYYAPTAPAYIGSYADVVVTPTSAAQSVAVRSTADLIASIGSELPITEYAGSRSNRREVPTTGALDDPGGDGQGLEDWGYRLVWSWLLAGNALGDVIDRRGEQLVTVDLLNPDDVTPSVVSGKPEWYVNGRHIDDPSRIAHWRVNPVAGRLMGLSPIEHHATTIGTSIATSRFGRQWFADGAHPSGLLYNELADLDAEQAAVAKQRVLQARGSSDPMVFGKGWKWENAQITPEESQFLQTQGLSEAQCARIFGPGFAEILGYETGGSMTYSNIVDRRQDLLVFSLNRWLRRYERVLSRFTPAGHWVEVNRDALLEATTLQRYQAHKLALDGQWRTPDEIRVIENIQTPIPGGDMPIKPIAASAPTQEASDEPDPGA